MVYSVWQPIKPVNQLYRFASRAIVAAALSVCALNIIAQPNLTPYQPSGWSDKVVVTRTAGSTNDSTGLSTADTLYVDWAVINDGTASTGGGFFNYLYVDGNIVGEFDQGGSLPVNAYAFYTNFNIGQLTTGPHTVEIVADATGLIAETNENDNTYTKNITVGTINLPNLTPVQPAGWSDKIVVARAPGTTTDSTDLTTADSLYVDWAVTNNGTAATTNAFFTYLYVDGVFKTNWSTPSPLNVGGLVAATNYAIGSAIRSRSLPMRRAWWPRLMKTTTLTPNRSSSISPTCPHRR